MTHYETLGITPEATADEIKQAFRRKASEHHPDRHDGDEAKDSATDRMKAVNHAYEVLGDPEKRARYDDPTIGLQEEARAMLRQFFASAISSSGRLEILDLVGSSLELQKTEAIEAIERMRKQMAKFKRIRAKVKVKSGENMVHMLIDVAMPELTANIEKAEHALRINKLAVGMLTAYEAEPDEPAPDPYRWRSPRDDRMDALMYGLGSTFTMGSGGT